jgi:hypothetical protein
MHPRLINANAVVRSKPANQPAKKAATQASRRAIRMEDILAEIERRRDAGDDPCDSCHATGMYGGKVCMDCLGQKVLLTAAEYDAILLMAGHHVEEDSILDAEILTIPGSEQ